MRGYRAFAWLLLTVSLLLSPMAAPSAQAQIRGGVQGGISVDPDQVYFGGHAQTAPLVDRLRFRPSVDVGIGENLTMVAVNFDFTYAFPARGPWNLYVGGGPSANFYNHDGGGSNTGAGFSFIVGAQQRSGLFFEAKVGAGDAAKLKFGVGYTFP
jgi:hypothetical protein